MDAAAEHGMNPVSKRQIQPEYGDEQTGTGRDCQSDPWSVKTRKQTTCLLH